MISLDLLRDSHACALPLPSPSPFVSFQAVPLLSLSLRANKKSPVPDLGQDFHPAVPPKLTRKRPLVSHTSICAALVTGAVPVGCYWVKDRSLRPPRAIRRNALCRDSTIRGSLKGSLPGYFSWSQVFLDCFALYADGAHLSTVDLHKNDLTRRRLRS